MHLLSTFFVDKLLHKYFFNALLDATQLYSKIIVVVNGFTRSSLTLSNVHF